ncbi:MAG TPA: L-ribulose-5-phosphate 4-epimerase AraD [Candidatus Hydrogenedentes bacterium]|nr:L-ribulose-5-phosphate 4-epimerase AraD [Candidatus Hydrogenedentota bacterium]HPG69251.1 L-ribulose-5-phosphate 4-epimerase AraD [Candidatus Hydrogenedentota bacterium]
MLDELKQAVLKANLDLVKHRLVILTWGNASAIDRGTNRVVIKPSGLSYDTMRAEDMAVVTLDGEQVEGECRPSVDLATHLVLYRHFPKIGGVVHTHSRYATAWAQAERPIPCFGTTHADLCHGEVPLVPGLTDDEVACDYERSIGAAIVRRFAGLDPMHYPAALAANHGPFTWGRTVADAVEAAVALEEVARMALDTLRLAPDHGPIPDYLIDKHFLRKHGENAYYGQR